MADARRAIRLKQAEATYAVRECAKLDTVADCDEVLSQVQKLRCIIIKNDFDAWSHYDRTKNLTQDECYKSNCVKAPAPPDCPRPSEKELWELVCWNELPENYYGLQLRAAVEKYLAALNGSDRHVNFS